MTSKNDRRHRVQKYPVPVVTAAINNVVYGDDNRRMLMGLFVANRTYEAVAADEHISVRGLHKRVGGMMPQVEDYLHKLQ